MALVPLYDYQKRYLADRSRKRAALWARSTGKNFAVALGIVLRLEQDEADGRGESWFCFAAQDGQTREMVRQAAIHSQAIGLAAPLVEEEHETLNERTQERRTVTMLSLAYPHGGRLVGLPTNPYSIRGHHGHVWGDEAGHWPNAEEIWRAAGPVASRDQYTTQLTGTPGDERGVFWEVMTGRREGWSAHRVDVYQAVREGAPIDPADLRSTLGAEVFETECELRWTASGSRYLPLELIAQCEDDATLQVPFVVIEEEQREAWAPLLDASHNPRRHPDTGELLLYDEPASWRRLFGALRAAKGQLTLGMDIGRTRDQSVIWIDERDGLIARTRAVVVLRKRRFHEQQAALFAALEVCARGAIDRGAIGAQLAEAAQEQFGSARVEGVGLIDTVKEALAVRARRRLEEWSWRIPAEKAVREAFHAIYRRSNGSLDAKRTELAGHGDAFWAAALALHAAEGSGGVFDPGRVWTGGAPRWSRMRGIA